MRLYNPYTRGYIEYPLNFDTEVYNYHIEHETVFCPYHTAWEVTILESGDKVYIPCGENRSRNIYVVTKFYLDKTVQFPRGIYTIPVSHWDIPMFNNHTVNIDDKDDIYDEDYLYDDDDYFDDDEFDEDGFYIDIDIDKLF